ncbi:hypothetical protein SLA2020_268180 [Shorea laevis]
MSSLGTLSVLKISDQTPMMSSQEGAQLNFSMQPSRLRGTYNVRHNERPKLKLLLSWQFLRIGVNPNLYGEVITIDYDGNAGISLLVVQTRKLDV